MNSKRVSFATAKALAAAGYPQGYPDTDIDWYYDDRGLTMTKDDIAKYGIKKWYAAPTYHEVWNWLWTEKDIKICVDCMSIGGLCRFDYFKVRSRYITHVYPIAVTPDSAIADCIDSLVLQKIIK